MKVAELVAQREASWRELDFLVHQLGAARRARRRARDVVWVDETPDYARRWYEGQNDGAHGLIRLAELYRSACADLMLAEAHDLPRDTVAYLHALVARAHNVLYRAQGFRFSRWARELFSSVPRQL